jgi:hypothetical protein
MAREAERHSFWKTLPGILTGVAALVTAVTGLMIGLSSNRTPGPAEPSHQPATSTVRAERPGGDSNRTADDAGSRAADPQTTSSTAASGTPAAPSSKEAMVIITAKDGSVARVYADSLQHRQTGRDLHLSSGQSISFDRIKTIEVTRLESDQARVSLTLVNGSVHTGSINAGLSPYAFTGVNDLGNFEIRVDNLARIAFER